MKYENVSRVNELVKKINKSEKELATLESYRDAGNLKVVIVNGSTNVSTIGIGDFEHRYTARATDFIRDCIELLKQQIDADKKELEKL